MRSVDCDRQKGVICAYLRSVSAVKSYDGNNDVIEGFVGRKSPDEDMNEGFGEGYRWITPQGFIKGP